ncbi:hypothetical protein Hena1_02020 [Erwinia phage Hena1]|uniref:Uncharacterized protein n=1 Tax=Erwinia phage Hena1 TaxID=2678601 RepID=A0A6B9JCI9_9CAUD|nr:DNA ligase [Erwinia phage Hena1]QGZ16352.1 hypothetical protein Hena1_02020 [Erwinia phage Hena1]
MFKWLMNFIFGTPSQEIELPEVLVHDFTERVPGHDIALQYYPTESRASAVITSLEVIEIGQLINIRDEDVLFSVDSVTKLAPMTYKAELSLVDPDEDEAE